MKLEKDGGRRYSRTIGGSAKERRPRERSRRAYSRTIPANWGVVSQIELAQKNLALTFDKEERTKMLDETADYSIREQCELLVLSRSGLYYKPRLIAPEKLALLNKIDEVYTQNPYYGSRRMTVVLNQAGYAISRPTTEKYMNEMGLEAIYPKKNLSKRNPEHRIYPYLLRDLPAQRPDHIWGTDITCIRLKGSFMYLVAYLDWYSR